MLTPKPFATLFVCVLLCAPAAAQVTERISVSSAGTQGNGLSESWHITPDGRFLTFSSQANNLVPGDTNGSYDVFVRDYPGGTTERVSLGAGGGEGNDASYDNAISNDGRYVAFQSLASDLVGGDTNGTWDVFVRDRQGGTTERVSVDSSEVQANGSSSFGGGLCISISADGRFVAFHSLATNLVPGDTNLSEDIFVRDRQLGTTERVSVDSGGAEGDGQSLHPWVSADGRYVAFASSATNLVPGDTNGTMDIFVRDRQSGTTERVSISSGAVQGNGDSTQPSISAEGRYVAFRSLATLLVAGDTNGVADIFVHDRQGGTTARVSVDSGGAQSSGVSQEPTISAGGQCVVFRSDAPNLVPGDTNGTADIFVRDLVAGTTGRVSIATNGNQGNNFSGWPVISGDGRQVLFESDASSLVAGDTNSVRDVFLFTSGAGRTEQESGGAGGAPSNGPSSSPAVSPDGRYVAFESDADNVGLVGTNGFRDIFLRDRQAGTTTRVSVDTGGGQTNGDSFHPAVSADGRYVAFDSAATNIVAGDTNVASDVFVRDLVSNTTTRVSVDFAGAQVNGDSFHPSISTDGRYVAFDSAATNLVPGDTNLVVDVFVHERTLNTTSRVSVDSGGTQGLGGGSSNPSMSSDGLSVAFESAASNLVTGDTNGALDIFVRDVLAGTTTRWSLASGGAEANGDSSDAAISGDAGSLAFQSTATNLVPGDTNLVVDVFVRRESFGTTDRVSVDSGGTQGLGGASTKPAISVDGRSVAFVSDATNLVIGDTNGAADVLVRDRQTGDTTRVSVDSGGTQGASSSGGASISADGRFIVFDSFANNLVLGDTNGFQDVFLRDEGTAAAFESFCYGDGSGAACPCNNSGAPGHGCENSGTTGGALLTATGVASLSADTVQFTCSGGRPTAFSIFLQGTTPSAPVTYGDGLLCMSGGLKLIIARRAVAGVIVAPQAGDLSISARSALMSAPISLGATRQYQVYYRDTVLGFCPSPLGSTFNVSNGIIVAWGG